MLRFFELALTRMQPAEAADALMAFAFAARFADRYPGFVDQAARSGPSTRTTSPERSPRSAHCARAGTSRQRCRQSPARPSPIAGELDPLVPASATRELAAAIPGARYREVPGAAHSVLAEGGAALLNEIVEFLADVAVVRASGRASTA